MKTAEQFIADAREVHGDLYDYTTTVYTGSKQKVTIGCRVHGPFDQRASNHLRGTGCPRCGGRVKLTTEQFVTRARETHGDRYDYTATVYTKVNQKVTIGCREHGPFDQEAASHLRGTGCPRCGGCVKLTTEQFVTRAREVHGDRYDYTATAYTGVNHKVAIGCREHGPFDQGPSNHLNGSGCPACGIRTSAARRSTPLEVFIVRAREVHGELYDYTATAYTGVNQKVAIGCRDHGPFDQRPSNHLTGSGCPQCAVLCSRPPAKTAEQFIARAREVHGDRYDYSAVIYAGSKRRVTIGCDEHGAFTQAPHNHLAGRGCLECGRRAAAARRSAA